MEASSIDLTPLPTKALPTSPPTLSTSPSIPVPHLILIDNLRERRRRTLGLLILIEFLTAQSIALESLGVRIEAQQDLTVAERVLLLHPGALGRTLPLLRTHDRLHLGAVDQARDVRIRHHVGGQQEIFLERTGCRGAAVYGVQCGERTGRPHDEATQMSTGCQLQEVESEDAAGFHAGDVSERLDEVLAVFFRVVDDQRPAALAVATVAEFPLAGAELAGFGHFGDVWASTDGFEEVNRGFGLGNGEGA